MDVIEEVELVLLLILPEFSNTIPLADLREGGWYQKETSGKRRLSSIQRLNWLTVFWTELEIPLGPGTKGRDELGRALAIASFMREWEPNPYSFLIFSFIFIGIFIFIIF